MTLGSKSHISSKIVIIILIMCVTCTIIALLAFVVCYVRRRERHHPIQSPMVSSSDKETSYSSTSNFISQRTSFVPETKSVINSPISHITSKIGFELTIPNLLVETYLIQSVGFYTDSKVLHLPYYYILLLFTFFCFFSR
jgi:hypothetical protein